ncbi:MAG: hypothetical protein J5851_08305 [Oscillospiraceae bacterium]|nr:hypothetical protein [Oscillospiraceae bacterium]
MGHDQRQSDPGCKSAKMIIPDDAYETGVLTVLSKDEFDAKESVREYHAIRSICLNKKTRMLIERFTYMLAAIPLVLNDLGPLLNREPLAFFFWVSLAIYLIDGFCLLFLKNMMIPAFLLPFFLFEALFIGDWTDLFTIILPIFSLGILTYFHERARRYVMSQPAYPDFRMIEVRVLRDEMSNERHVLLPGRQESASYPGLLDELQPETDAIPSQQLTERSVPDAGEPVEDPYADMLGDMSE